MSYGQLLIYIYIYIYISIKTTKKGVTISFNP